MPRGIGATPSTAGAQLAGNGQSEHPEDRLVRLGEEQEGRACLRIRLLRDTERRGDIPAAVLSKLFCLPTANRKISYGETSLQYRILLKNLRNNRSGAWLSARSIGKS